MSHAELMARVRRLEFRARRAVRDALAGEYRSAFKGTGLAFEEVREYQPGDDVRLIDWNVTARAGTPFVKRFVEERELTVWLVVDVSPSLDFGTARLRKRDVAAELAAFLAFCAVANRDRVGLVAFSDRVERAIRPGRGSRHALRLVRDVLAIAPRGRGTALAPALAHLGRVQRRPAVVFLLSDFFADLPPLDLRVAGRRHDLVLVAIADPREEELPSAGLIRLRDAESGSVRLVDTGSAAVRAAYADAARHRHANLERLARSAGCDLVRTDTAGEHADALIRLFRLRAHRRERQ